MPTAADYLFMLTAGVLGGAHCIGMCGGFVLMYSVEISGAERPSGTPFTAHLMYNMGRILTYSLAGGFMGYAGSFVDAAGRLKGVQGLALLLAGVLMIVMGLHLMGLFGASEVAGASAVTGAGPFRRAFTRLMRERTPLAIFPLGLLLGLVPCGLSYTMEIRAASSGGFWQGFTLMAAFGAGTVPALMGLGFLSSSAAVRFRERVYKAAAVLVLLMGAQALLRGLAFNGWIPHGPLW